MAGTQGLEFEAQIDEFDLPGIITGIPKGFAGWDQPGTYIFTVPPGVTRIHFFSKGADGGWGTSGGGTATGGGCPPVGGNVVTLHMIYGGAGATMMHVVRVVPGSQVKVVVGTGGAVNGGVGGDTTITLTDGTVLTAKGSALLDSQMTFQMVAPATWSLGVVSSGAQSNGAPKASGGNIQAENNNGGGAVGVGSHGWAVAMW